MRPQIPSADTLFEWIGAGKQLRVREVVEAIPEEQRSPEITCAYCAAVATCLDLPTPSRTADLRNIIGIMHTLLKGLSAKNPYHKRVIAICYNLLAHAHYQLGDFKAALSCFKKAPDVPGDDLNRQLIKLCREAAERPKDTVSFRARTQKAWTVFLSKEEALRGMIQDASGDPKLQRKLEKKIDGMLQLAFSRTDWSWQAGDVPCITFNPMRSKCLLLTQQYFLAHAPQALQGRWAFQVGFPAPTDQQLQAIRADKHSFSDMDVQLEHTDEDKFRLELYHKDLPMEEGTGSALQVLDILNRCVGEVVLLCLVSSISINTKPLDGSTVKLGDLLPTLASMGYVDRADIQSLILQRRPYTHKPDPHNPGQEYHWRDDIIRGSTLDASIGQSFIEDTSDEGAAPYLGGSGAVPGFVVFPLQGQSGSTALMQALLDELDTALDREIGIALGEAEGVEYGYLDLLAFDQQPVLQTVTGLLQRHNIPWACWHSFHTLDTTVPLY